MIKLIIFSKDRPLQLSAYFDSLKLNNEWHDQCEKFVISPSNQSELSDKYNFIWIKEDQGFDKAFRDLISSLDDNDSVILGVDDFIWFRPFDLERLSILQHDILLGYSLRLGTNINGYNEEWNKHDEQICVIDWRNKPNDFGYPFDVSQSVYLCKTVKRIISECDKFRIPNDLESHGVNWVFKNHNRYPFLAFNNGYSYGACADLNRVQDLFQNPINGTEEHTKEALIDKFNQGYRINVANYKNLVPSSCFIGSLNFSITKI